MDISSCEYCTKKTTRLQILSTVPSAAERRFEKYTVVCDFLGLCRLPPFVTLGISSYLHPFHNPRNKNHLCPVLSDLRAKRWSGVLRYQQPRFRLFGIFGRSRPSRLYFGKNLLKHFFYILPTRCTRTAEKPYFSVNITLPINFVSTCITR